MSEETKQKIREARLREWSSGLRDRNRIRMIGLMHGGKHHTEDSRRKLSLAFKGKRLRENNPNWRGGVNDINNSLRKTRRYKDWRKAVFERDDYTCVLCGIRGCVLRADHIKPFAVFEESRFDIGNGRTLCDECHKKTDTYGVNKLTSVYAQR